MTEKRPGTVIGAAVVVKEETIGAIIGSHGSAKGAMGEEPAYPHLELLEKGTDWFDEIFRLDSVRNYQIGLSGGAENVSYNLSVGSSSKKK